MELNHDYTRLDFGVCQTFSEHVVVGVWNIEKFLSSCPQISDGLDDVMGPNNRTQY